MQRLLVGLFTLACLAAPGCGYRLAGGGGPDTPVTVETLGNDTLEPGVELDLAAALRREVTRTDGLRAVDTPSPSGYRVAGRVARVDTIGRTFTSGVRALEYTVDVQLDLVVTGPGGRRVAIDPFATRASELYLASTDVQISRKNRDEALRRVSALLARRIRREIERAERGSTIGSDGSDAAPTAGRKPGD